MSEYCKYHPNDPTCYTTSSKYESITRQKPDTIAPPSPFQDTFKHTNRRNITDVINKPKPTVEYTTPNPTVEAFYEPTPRRRKGDGYYAKPPPRRDFRPANEPPRRKGVVELEQPENRLKSYLKDYDLKDQQQQFTNPNYSNMPSTELEQLRRRYNKRLNAGKKRAQELLTVGSHEVIESRNQHKYGHLTEAAYKHAYKGKKAAMNQLKEGGKYIEELNDFEIVPEFSDYDYLALRNPKTGELVQAGRGSDTEFLSANTNIDHALKGRPLGERLKRGVNDWFVNSKFMLNKAHETGTYRRQDRDLVRFAEAFGKDTGEVALAGHSKAGATAEHLGKKYGNKVYSFNPAVHPSNKLNNTEVHPNTRIETFGEEFDFVSGARNFHDIPDYMKVHRYTTTTGTELDTLGRHDHSQAIPTPERVVNGNIIVKRNTKLKNRLGMLGGTGGEIGKKISGVNNAIFALSSLALEPEYTNKNERKYRKKMMGVDLAKGVLEFEGVSALGVEGARGIGRYTQALAPGAAIGAYTDLLMLDQQDNVPLHQGLAKIRHAIFGADAPPDPDAAKPPAVITWFNKNFSKKRYEQDQKLAHTREVYDTVYEGDLTFDEFVGVYHDADGYALAESIESLGYDSSREHHLSTDELKLAEAKYKLRQELIAAAEGSPILERLLRAEGFDVDTTAPTFDYSLAETEDRERIKDQLRFGQEFGVEMEGVSGGGALAFTTQQAEQEARPTPKRTRRRMLPVPQQEPETFTMGGKTYVEQLP